MLMLTSVFQREHCVSHRRFWLLLLQVHRRGLHNCHWGSLIKEISTSASFSFYELQSVKMIPWRWSVWWPSMEPGGLASGTSGRGLRTSRTILTQFFSHVPNIFLQLPHPSQRGHCLGSSPHRLPHHLRFTVRQPLHCVLDKHQIC